MRNGWETAPSSLEGSLKGLIKEAMRDVVREEIANARPMVEPRLFDTKQAGHYIGRPEAIVRKLAREKRIRVTSGDSKMLFDRCDLDDFVEREKEAGHVD